MLRACAGLAALAAAPLAAGPAQADLVLRNGVVFTADPSAPRATAVAVRDGVIVYVGDDTGAASFIADATLAIDLAGRMAAPGFVDAHMHPMSGGMRFLRCSLQGAAALDAVRAAIAACLAPPMAEPWLVGFGLAFERLPKDDLTVAALDRLVPDRPAFLASEYGATAWVNSKALAAAGLARDSAASGVIAGADAVKARRAIPGPTQTAYRRALQAALREAARYGVTSIIDASVSPAMLEAYAAAAAAGEIDARIVAAQRYDASAGLDQIGAMAARARRIDSEFLRADAAKIFLDGEFEDGTAALKTPYADAPGERGALYVAADRLGEAVRRMQRAGFQVHFHAMGDAAVAASLDAIENAGPADDIAARRHQIAHVGLATPKDIARFANLGVIASFQPLLAPADDAERAALAIKLGEERMQGLFPFPELKDAGAALVIGSDWPSPSINPLAVMAAALERRFGAEPGGAFAIGDLLTAYTIAGARAARSDRRTGSLEVGKAADIAVFDRNLLEAGARELAEARVVMTLLAGRPTWCDPSMECER